MCLCCGLRCSVVRDAQWCRYRCSAGTPSGLLSPAVLLMWKGLLLLQDEVLIAGFGRRGHAVGDIPGVRFKVRRPVAMRGTTLRGGCLLNN